MSNFRFSSKLKILAIISSAIIVVGMILGTVFHFVSGSFFNYSGEYKSFKSVTVNYLWVEVNGENNETDIEEIASKAFSDAGIVSYGETCADTGVGNEIIYKFFSSTSNEALDKAVAAINAEIVKATSGFNDLPQSRASWQTEDSLLGGGYVLMMASVALAVVVAVQLIYTAIRFGLSAGALSFVANLHNLALYAAVLALCRIPVASSAIVFGVIVSLITAITVSFTLERAKRNFKDSDNAKLSIEEICDLSAMQTFKGNLALTAFLAITSALAIVGVVISSFSPILMASPVLCALIAFLVCGYGNELFVPAIYPCIKKLCGKKSAKPSQKKAE